MINLTIAVILSYLAGSVPASIIICKIFTGTDIRKFGSGNPGAANVYRTAGPSAGALTAAFDIFKGFAAAFWIARIAYDIQLLDNETVSLITGGAAIIGHIFSVFLKFDGGKGVATAAGVLLFIAPLATVITVIIFIAVIITSRISALGSIISSCSMPLILFIMRGCFNIDVSKNANLFSLLIAILILFVHRKNIERLIKGKENKI